MLNGTEQLRYNTDIAMERCNLLGPGFLQQVSVPRWFLDLSKHVIGDGTVSAGVGYQCVVSFCCDGVLIIRSLEWN